MIAGREVKSKFESSLEFYLAKPYRGPTAVSSPTSKTTTWFLSHDRTSRTQEQEHRPQPQTDFHSNHIRQSNMSTIFEPTLSTSTMRPPLSSAEAPSMADSLPNINFGFDELRERMAKFTVKFDTFIEQGRKRVLEERNQFRMNVTELKGAFKVLFTMGTIDMTQRING